MDDILHASLPSLYPDRLSFNANVDRAFRRHHGTIPKYILWAREYLTLLKTDYPSLKKTELINFCLDAFKDSSPLFPCECSDSILYSQGKKIVILGVAHTRSLDQKGSDDEAILLTWLQLMIRTHKPNILFLEAGMGNPRLTPQQKVMDPLRFETSLQNLRLHPNNTDSEMYFAARRALVQNPCCDVYNMDPISISEALIQHLSAHELSDPNFTLQDLYTAHRSASMLPFFLGPGKYEGPTLEEFKHYIIHTDSNSKEKWETSFEVMKYYIPNFESIISDPTRHSEIKLFVAPSSYVSSPTLFNIISDLSCSLREESWKETILSYSKGVSMVVCGASHTDNLKGLFRDSPIYWL